MLYSPSKPPKESQRFGMIDGLRGMAAIGVVIHHIIWFTPWDAFGSEAATDWVYRIGYWGKCGVPIFFVISGFVIAHSLRKAVVTPAFVGKFFVRRSMRLDPPYWCSMVAVILISLVCTQWLTIEAPSELPTVGQLVAHVFYLQNILGYENISVGYWTLCIEIQFYMLFVVMLGLAQYLSQLFDSFNHAASLSGTAHAVDYSETTQEVLFSGTAQAVRSSYSTSPKALIAVFAPVMFASLFTFTYFGQLDDWFLRYYCLFCLGACLSACRNNMLPKAIAWVALGLFAIRIAIEFQRGVFCGLAVGLLIMLADYRSALNSWLMSRTWQYLGKISYSLYLIHYPVAHLIMHMGKRTSGDNVSMIYVWMTISLFASVAAAELLYRIVGAPSLALAQRFGNRSSTENAQENQVAHDVLVGEELDSIQLANRFASPAIEPVLESQSV